MVGFFYLGLAVIAITGSHNYITEGMFTGMSLIATLVAVVFVATGVLIGKHKKGKTLILSAWMGLLLYFVLLIGYGIIPLILITDILPPMLRVGTISIFLVALLMGLLLGVDLRRYQSEACIV